jgi:hypothetical protein
MSRPRHLACLGRHTLSVGVAVGQLRSIIETCEPRPDVLSGGLADSHFAAQLDQVVRNPDAYPIYGDPGEFFALTYPTAGLRRLLARTFGRLSGAKVEGAEHGVIRAETSFGGGKTHSLMAVYHLATGARPANLADFLDPAILPERCQVAAGGSRLSGLFGVEDNLARGGCEDDGRDGGATCAHDDRKRVVAEPGGQAVRISLQVELGDGCWSGWVGDGRRTRQADARCPFDEEGQ